MVKFSFVFIVNGMWVFATLTNNSFRKFHAPVELVLAKRGSKFICKVFEWGRRIWNFTYQVFSYIYKASINSCTIFVSSNKSTLWTVIFRRRFDDFNVFFQIFPNFWFNVFLWTCKYFYCHYCIYITVEKKRWSLMWKVH